MFWPHEAIFRQRILMETTAQCPLISIELVDVRHVSQFWCSETFCSFLSQYCGLSVPLCVCPSPGCVYLVLIWCSLYSCPDRDWIRALLNSSLQRYRSVLLLWTSPLRPDAGQCREVSVMSTETSEVIQLCCNDVLMQISGDFLHSWRTVLLILSCRGACLQCHTTQVVTLCNTEPSWARLSVLQNTESCNAQLCTGQANSLYCGVQLDVFGRFCISAERVLISLPVCTR